MEWKKIEKLKTFDLNYFIGKDTFGDKGFQNIFVYHTRIITIELKEDNDTNYIISWKSKGLYNSKSTPSDTAFLHKVKHFRYEMEKRIQKTIQKERFSCRRKQLQDQSYKCLHCL